MVNQKGHLTSHTKLCEKLLCGAGIPDGSQDQQTSTLNIDTGFETEISVLSEYREAESNTENIMCYTDGSKMNDKVDDAPMHGSAIMYEQSQMAST